MKYIIDFIEEKKDVSFDELALTEVDNVIFSRLIYLDFSNFIGKTLKEIAQEYQFDARDEARLFGKTFTLTEELLKKAAETKRYGGVIVFDFKEISSASYATAFCGAVFKIQSEVSYIAIRGTDDKIMSFYEDAELAYSFPVPSQVASLQYVRNALSEHGGRFYIGGHSKGGNAALFAYVFLDENARERIIEVYNNDGPGFPRDIAKIFITEQINKHVETIVPEDSIVGRMLETSDEFTIVKSSAVGGSQHNVFTWIVNDNEFQRAEKFGAFSEFIESRLTQSLDTISLEEMKNATNAVYNSLVESGITSTDDISLASIRNAMAALREATKNDGANANEASQLIKDRLRDIFESIDTEALKEKFKPKEKSNNE